MKRYLFWAGLFLVFAVASKLYTGPFRSAVDAWVGDVGIVACLYFVLGAFFTRLKPFNKLIIIAAVAVFVECFQLSGIPKALNLPAPFIWILGSQFDVLDFLFYAIGLAIAYFMDKRMYVES